MNGLSSHFKAFKMDLKADFAQKKKILPATRRLVNFVDDTLYRLFHQLKLQDDHAFCLLAVGSYGRRELQLYSDIDLILLHEPDISERSSLKAQSLIQQCWDAGLNISHQITTVNQLTELAAADLSVISSIMDMRMIAGRSSLRDTLAYTTHPLHIWSSNRFFEGKLTEQHKRYEKYGETAYNLEPNVKNGPGGLRDLQILLSIGKRHFGIRKLSDGISSGFFTEKEYEQLLFCLHFLWRVRFALHLLADKQEERLLFDYQIKLAQFFSYQDKAHHLAIEQFMKDYFQVIKRSRELNDVLLQWFSESIIEKPRQKLLPLDRYFQLANHYIEVRSPDVFQQKPVTLLRLFHHFNQPHAIKGVRANTIRLIRQHLYLINKKFRQLPEARQLFLAIFQSKQPPYPILQRMNRYGILGRYLDCFAQVTGQMQYDLFHVYTVDQHTLFVIRNLCRFLEPEYQSSFPLAAQLMAKISYKDVLYLAALFHDIAKGRGGDHATLGALDAECFAREHELGEEKKLLLAWLVKHHLLMSQTAQRQDIYDPQIIQTFCAQLPHSHYLDYLYLLTVADICATNPNLWTTWKDSLLKELYRAASTAMQPSLLPINEESLIQMRQAEALQILRLEGIDANQSKALWQQIKGKYFLHESPEIIARHTKAILENTSYPLIIILPHHSQGGTEVFIYTPHRDDRFAIVTSVLSNHITTIQEASIITCDHQFDLDTYIILDEHNKAFFNPAASAAIVKDLQYFLKPNAPFPPLVKRRVSRTKAHFNIETILQFSHDPHLNVSQLFLIANDRPGLLSKVSRVFVEQKLHLHNAKIATAGERAEDTFLLSNHLGQALSEAEEQALDRRLRETLHQD
ncbi:MAG: [protein-PII] uridylyltransferase [Legionellaceae bacterium]|nr:[protein-PII] uridylyltransferase [Legionellaceae bacterium]